MYAFRCKHCGHLHTSDDAAESAHPHACRVCGKGVIYTVDPAKVREELQTRYGKDKAFPSSEIVPGYHKVIDATNWEPLADATDARLTELGLGREHVAAHTPWKSGEQRQPRMIERNTQETVNSQDKAG